MSRACSLPCSLQVDFSLQAAHSSSQDIGQHGVSGLKTLIHRFFKLLREAYDFFVDRDALFIRVAQVKFSPEHRLLRPE